MGWFSSLIRDDRLIFGALGTSTIAMLLMVRFMLEKWREEAEIKPVQPKTQYITQDTEDALQVGTLDTLLCHYNFAIRETAAKIVCDRAVNDPSTFDILLHGITRPDYDERMKHLRALAVITDTQSLPKLNNWKAYTALVRSLELSLDNEQEKLDDENWDEYPMRDMTEKLCLMFLTQLVNRYDAEMLIRARFVERWLAKQNWGDDDEERQANFTKYVRHKTNRLCDIIGSIQNSRAGRVALEKAGLIGKGCADDEGDGHIPLANVDRFSLLVTMNMSERDTDQGRALARVVQPDLDEHRRRQQHREAMVFNDGSRPVNRDDIIQRDLGSPR